jgi:hypothetical protein
MQRAGERAFKGLREQESRGSRSRYAIARLTASIENATSAGSVE